MILSGRVVLLEGKNQANAKQMQVIRVENNFFQYFFGAHHQLESLDKYIYTF
jgi:hypothetical protein